MDVQLFLLGMPLKYLNWKWAKTALLGLGNKERMKKGRFLNEILQMPITVSTLTCYKECEWWG